MSAFNASQYIDEAIESVLSQTFRNFELLITDDKSTDNTLQKLIYYSNKDDRIKVFTNKINIGLPASLNKMVLAANGHYIARMDADDICKESRLQTQYSYMQRYPSIDACFSGVNLIKHDGEFICRKWIPDDILIILRHLPYYNFLVHPTAMIRKLSIESVGCYNVNFLKAQDWDLWKRMVSSDMKLDIINHVLLDYRLTKTGNSSSLSLSKHKSSNFHHANILIQNKNRIKALKLVCGIRLLELPEFFVRLILPMSLFRFILKIRSKRKDSLINKLLSQ